MKKKETRLIHTRGRRLNPTVNPPVERASTLLFPDEASLYGAKPTYGRMGLAVHRELEAALCELEGAERCRLTGNGVQAVALALLACVQSGGHVLFPDCAYNPSARFCERRLKAMGIDVERYAPRIGAGIERLFRGNTQALFVESPGSMTFEVSDLPAMAEAARKRGIRIICDNTWAAGFFHQPLDLGADISLQALTKYVAGHADAFGGAVMTRDKSLATRVGFAAEDFGFALAPDEAYAALRGLRTLPLRLKAHEKAGLEVARWLETRCEVSAVMHPALASHPDHAIWQRDFTGASGLFAFVLNGSDAETEKFISGLHLFGLGFSWGGFESLIIPPGDQFDHRKFHSLSATGRLMRIHVGLEAVEDLKADLEYAFLAMAA